MKQFSKVNFFQANGLIQRRYNFETDQFDFSSFLLLYSYITFFVKLTCPLKLLISLFWERENLAQLYIGNVYKYARFILPVLYEGKF